MAAPIYSTTALNDIGIGLGYIYVTSPIASSGSPTISEVVEVLENTAEGVRKAKLLGVEASALAVNRIAVGVITIDAPTGGGTITNIVVNSIKLFDVGTPIAYTGATTAAALTQLIVDAINSYSPGDIANTFTAQRIDNVLYIFTSAEGVSAHNNQSTTITSTGNFTYTEDQEVSGGSTSNESFDDSFGYQFFLDADYEAGGCCSGAGTATPTDISKALEITPYIVNIGLQSAIPRKDVTLSSNALSLDRKGALTFIKLTGEGSADDDLDTVIVNNPSDGDRILLFSKTNTITVNSGTGNIIIKSSTYDVVSSSTIELTYLSSTGVWYELNRSTQVIGSIADYRAAGFGMFGIETASTQAVGTGGAVVFDPNSDSKLQILTGTSTLVSSQSYDATGVVEDGDEFWIRVDAQVDVAAHALQIYGRIIPSDLAAQGGYMVYSRYMGSISRWQTHVYPLLDDGAMSYPFQVYSGMISAGAVTTAKVVDNLKNEWKHISVSFESLEQGDMKLKMPACTVTDFYVSVSKAIAGTDNATIVPKDNGAVAMTGGTVTLTASSAIGSAFTSTATGNNTFTEGQVMTLTTNKTTAGGKAIVSFKITKS